MPSATVEGGRGAATLAIACWALRVLAFLSFGGVVKLCLAWSDAGARFIDILFALPLGLGLVVMFWAVGEIAGTLRDRR